MYRTQEYPEPATPDIHHISRPSSAAARVASQSRGDAWKGRSAAPELPGRSVDDANIDVLDEQDDVGSGVVPPDPDAVQLAIDPQR